MTNIKIHGVQNPAVLAQDILTLSPFKGITKEEYKILLIHLLQIKHIEKTENGMLRLSDEGERIVNSYDFCAVFENEDVFTVQSENEIIGKIQLAPKVGTKFILAGYMWRCLQIDWRKKLVIAERSNGTGDIMWLSGSHIFLHEKIMNEMNIILTEEEEYRYLDNNARKKLREMREYAKKHKLTERGVIKTSEDQYAVMLWMQSNKMEKIFYALQQYGYDVRNVGYYLIVETDKDQIELEKDVEELMKENTWESTIHYPKKVCMPNKFVEYIPDELLRQEYLYDYLMLL